MAYSFEWQSVELIDLILPESFKFILNLNEASSEMLERTSYRGRVAMLVPTWIISQLSNFEFYVSDFTGSTPTEIEINADLQLLPEQLSFVCKLLHLNQARIESTRTQLIEVLKQEALPELQLVEELINIRTEYFNHFDGLSDSAVQAHFKIPIESEQFHELITTRVRETALTASCMSSKRFYENEQIKALQESRASPVNKVFLFDPLIAPLAKRLAELIEGKSQAEMIKLLALAPCTDPEFIKRAAEISNRLKSVQAKYTPSKGNQMGLIGSGLVNSMIDETEVTKLEDE